jgi:hypothetical protein
MSIPESHLPLFIPLSVFAAMHGKFQSRALRNLDNAASNCSGKTAVEADQKRKPYAEHEKKLRAIYDEQAAIWIETGNIQQLNELIKKQIAIFNLKNS